MKLSEIWWHEGKQRWDNKLPPFTTIEATFRANIEKLIQMSVAFIILSEALWIASINFQWIFHNFIIWNNFSSICLMDESHENLKSKDALKILEMEASTYPNESSESYIDTRHTYKHKCLCMLFRFSVLFTNWHFIIE